MVTLKRNILLNPGPATTTDTVKLAQVVPDICPRETEFGDVLAFVESELTRIVADPIDYSTVLFGGSGTAAVDAVMSSVVGEEAVVIVNNGAYGKRMCEMAETYGLDYYRFDSPSNIPLDLAALETFLNETPRKASYLAIVHHETTTGLLNDIAAIGAMCARYGIELLVDAVSSYAAIPIRMKEMNISYLAATSGKNIQGMAGVAFVVAEKSRLLGLERKKARNYYLDLYAQYAYFVRTRQTRFTPPVQTVYALRQAIVELLREGIEARYARYAKCWETLVDGMNRLGFETYVPTEAQSKLITTFMEPACDKYDFHAMHDYLYERGFTIYPGKLDRVGTFRIANIGAISDRDIEAFLEVLGQYVRLIDFTGRVDGLERF